MNKAESRTLEAAISRLGREAWKAHPNSKESMKITEDMNLAGLIAHMREPYTLIELLRLRSLLCDSQYFDGPLSDVPGHRMSKFVRQAGAKHNDAGKKEPE